MATTSVIFSLVDSTAGRFYSRIYISPISYPLVFSGSIVVGDSIASLTSDVAPIQTIGLVPNQYEVRCIGQDNTYETQFYISVPSSSTPVSASAILYNIQNFTANTTASYAVSSSYATTASYALNGGGGGGVWTDAGTYIVNNNAGFVSASYIETPSIQANTVVLPSQSPEYILATNDTYEVVSTTTTPLQLEYINNVTSDIQQQLNDKYGSGSVIQTPYIDFTVDGAPTYAEGRVFYDSTQHTLCVYNDQSNVTLNVGEEQFVRIVNKTHAIITNGSAVTISGSQGHRPKGILAQSTLTSGSNSYGIIGIATSDIAANDEGMVTILGVVRSINTSGYTAGDTLYVSSSAGKITNVKPALPYELIKIGIALNSTANGSILVSPYDVIHPSDISGYGDLTVTNNQANININTIPSNSYGRLVFKDSGSERVAIQFLNNQFDTYYTTSGRSNALEIYNNTGSTIFFNSGSERMRITKDGSILINKPGVTSSAYKVEVNGNVSASAVTATTMAIGITSNVGSTIQCNGNLYMGTSNNSGLRTYNTEHNLQLYGYYNVNVAGQAGAQYSQATVFDVNGNVAIGVPARSTTGAMTTGRFYVSASNGTDPLITANNGAINSFIVNPIGSIELNNGSGSIMIGKSLGNTTTSTSSYAIEIGTNIFNNNVSNSYSIAMGYNVGCGGSTVTSDYSVQMGWYAGYSSKYSDGAVIIGKKAGQNANTASNAVFIGNNAGYTCRTGSGAVCIGLNAGLNLTDGTNTTCIGAGAGQGGSAYGLYAGWNAGATANTSSYAVMLGSHAGYYSTQSTDSVMIGREAGFRALLANKSVFVGTYAGYYNYASGSICLGYRSGYDNKTGSNNIFLGYGSDVISDTATVSNSVAIGINSRISQNNTITLGGTGSYAVNVGIGTSTPSAKLDLSGSVASEKLLNIKNNAGTQIMLVSSSGAVVIGNNTNIHSTVTFQVNTGTDKNIAYQTSGTGIKLNAYNDAATTNIPLEINGFPVVIKCGESERGRFDTNGLTVTGNVTASYAGFYCPGNTANSGLKVGALEVQGFAVNNNWFGDNVFYNGSNFIARAAGYVGLFYFQGSEGQFRFSDASLTAGATWSPTVIQKMYGPTKTIALGGVMPTTAGNFANAVLYVSGSGLVGINNVNPATALDVTGTTRTTAFVTPTTLPATLYTGSTYFSASFLFIYTGTAWKSASLS
jgi:hypothetical protein